MQHRPKITIVTPSYNQGEYLAGTIESILSQDYPNLEYFVVDGGSNDASVSIIKSFDEQIDWWVSEPDEGQTDAINKGFRRATGDLLCWVNSDDILLPGALDAVAKCYLEEGGVDIIHANCVYIDHEGKVTRVIRTPAQNKFWMNRGVWFAQAPAVFFSREMVENLDYLRSDLRLSMDIDLWLRMFEANARIGFVPRPLGAFRWHNSSKTEQEIKRRSKRAVENPETEMLFNQGLLNSSQPKRWRWRYLWKAYQVVNLNYLRAWWDGRRLSGLLWKEALL